MADINLKTILQVRNGTTEEWGASSYTLRAGELGFDTDLNVLKIGDGTSNWATLEPVNKAEFAKLFATAAQGTKADSALQGVKVGEKAFTIEADKVASITVSDLLAALGVTPDEYLTADDLTDYVKGSEITTGTENGTIKVKGVEVAVKGLGSAAYQDSDSFDAAGAASAVDVKVTALDARVKTNETDIGTLKTQIQGLSGAMHFVGESSTDPAVEVTIEGKDTFASGDVCVFGKKEYVYDGEKWSEFGNEGDHITRDEVAQTYATKAELTAQGTAADGKYATKTALEEEVARAKAAEKAAQDAADGAQSAAEAAQSDATKGIGNAAAAKKVADAAMPKAGGAFTGPVTLNANPTTDLGAATKKYVDAAKQALQGAIDAIPAATVTDIKADTANDAGVTVAKSGTVYTVGHKKYATTGPSEGDTVQTSYLTGMTVVNGHLTKVTSTSLEAGLNTLTSTFVLDGGKADGTWAK